MAESIFSLKPIAHMQSDFSTKFGIPRQSGIVDALRSTIIFEPEFRNPEALRGLEGYSYIWLIWGFSESPKDTWSPTVRPPRLGGNIRMGVFATRSPFRPNSLGLSSVKILEIENTAEYGHVIHVAGADLMNGSPIFDVKPYVPDADSHPDALAGFASPGNKPKLQVDIPREWAECIPEDKLDAIIGILSQDPRPSYQQDPGKIYGMEFSQMEIKFCVEGKTVVITEVSPIRK